ncbi:MAG: LPS assembly lipoprotein LptE [Phycisphaerales bacterium]
MSVCLPSVAPSLRRFVALLLLLLLLPACGYSFNQARPTSARTVAVPVFRNDTFTHGLEAHLTDAVIKEIQRRTPWVVTSAGGSAAQSTLSGTITAAELRALSTSSRTGLVQEQAFELTIDFTWADSTGRPIVERRNFKALESFIPERGVSERTEVAHHAAIQELARAIVHEMRSAW